MCQLNILDWMFILSLASFLPMLWLQANSLWSKPHLQFFPLAILAFCYFIGLRLSKISTTTSGLRFSIGLLVSLCSLIIAIGAVFISSPWLSQAAAICLIAAWLLIRAGSISWYTALAPISLLLITLPFPAGYDSKLIQFLQAQSSRAASTVLDCMSILHLPEGNILELSHKKLFVDEACSGVDSLYALMAICLSIVLWFRQRFFVALASLSLVPIWASCSNIARLVTIVLGLEWMDIDLSHGMPHTILGLIVFACAFGCDYAFIRFIGSMFGENPNSTKHILSTIQCREVHSKLSVIVLGILAASFVLIGAYSSRVLKTGTMLQFPSFSDTQIAELQSRHKLPNQLRGWQLESFYPIKRSMESSMGHHSNVWQYNSQDGSVIVSTDFPFRGFHLLDICYEGAGWRLLTPSRQLEQPMKLSEGNKYEAFYPHLIEIKNDDGRFGVVAYALFQLDGKPIQSSAKAVRGFERFEQTLVEPISYQIQIFYSSTSAVDDTTKNLILLNLADVMHLLGPSFKLLLD